MSLPGPLAGRPLTRRQFFALLLSTTALIVFARRGHAGPLDQGIGGTGVAPPTDESDRGIGGTGVIGTIRKFGSIIVNDLRISYAKDAEVRIDGQPATAADLKIGQVVRVAARGPNASLSTQRIDVTSEVVGPISGVGKSQLTVLGQKVATGSLKTAGLKTGDVVAVSGLRRNDGTIVASLIERSPGAASRVAGPLDTAPDGALRVGGLPVSGVDPVLIGRRVLLTGRQDGRDFVATSASAEASLLPGDVRSLSIESYVERRGDGLQLGSGYAVSGDNLNLPAGRSVRAVLQTSVGADGRLTVESLRAGNRTYGGGGFGGGRGSGNGGGSGGGNRGPGGGGPGGAGRGGFSGGAPSGRGESGFGGGRSDGGYGNPDGGRGAGGFGPPGGGFGGPGGGFGGPGGGYGGPGGGYGGGGPGGGFGGGGGPGGGGPGGGGGGRR